MLSRPGLNGLIWAISGLRGLPPSRRSAHNRAMIYKFKSKAAADMIFLPENGRQLLAILGKADAAQGIIEPADMPAALQALQTAIAQAEQAQAQAAEEARARGEKPLPAPAVGLRQRFHPFMAMLERCQRARQAIVWGG